MALSFVRAVRIACLKTFRSGIVVHVEPAPDKYFCGEIKPGSRFTHRQAVTDNRPDDHEFKFIGIMIIFAVRPSAPWNCHALTQRRTDVLSIPKGRLYSVLRLYRTNND